MKKLLFFLLGFLAVCLTLGAQNAFTVKGKVCDEQGQPVVGAVVLLQGSRNVAAQTGADGSYSIRIPSGTADPVLEFNILGYETAVEHVSGRSLLDVILAEENNQLNEVVVVGYGTQKKVNLTGSVSSIDFETITEGRTIVSTSAALAGLTPGMSVTQTSGHPGEDAATIRIRGMGTFSADAASPLVLVDGVEWSMEDVNPNDIANISVLKDAASTAIYGTRASNGVILITTKTGDEKAPKVTYSFKEIMQTPYTNQFLCTNYARTMEVINEACDNEGRVHLYSQASINAWKAAELTPNELTEQGVPYWQAYPNTDWFSEIFSTGFSSEHNLSVTGGSKRVRYMVSAGYLDNKGIMNRFDIKSGTKKYNIRANIEADVNDWISFGTRIFGQRQEYGRANVLAAFRNLGTPGTPVGGPGAWGVASNNVEESDNAINAVQKLAGSTGTDVAHRLSTTGYLKLHPFKGFSLEGSFNYSPIIREKQSWAKQSNGQYWNYRLNVPTKEPVLAEAEAGFSVDRSYMTTTEALARYDVSLGAHEIGALLGYSNQQSFAWSWNGTRKGAASWDLPAFNTYSEMKDLDGNPIEGWALQSFFGRLNWAFRDKYLAEADFRVDGSSKFGPKSRYGFFPSASVGWKIHKEDFMAGTRSWLDNLKLRFSLGRVGNCDGIGNYQWQATYSAENVVYEGVPTSGFVTTEQSNLTLSWETTRVANLGLDAGFFKNRLTAEVDLYDRLTSGILYTPRTYLTMGFLATVPANRGKLDNRGVELSLNWKDRIGKDFHYWVGTNFSFNRNRVVSFKGPLVKEWRDGEYYTNFADAIEMIPQDHFYSAQATTEGGYICEGRTMGEHYLLELYHGTGEGYTGGEVDINAGPVDGMIRTESDMLWVQKMLASGYMFSNNVSAKKDQLWYGDFIYADRDGDKNYGDDDDREFNGHSAIPTTLLGINLGCSWRGLDLSMTWSGAFGFWILWTNSWNLPSVGQASSLALRIMDDHYFYDPDNPADERTNLTGNYPRLLYGNARSNGESSNFYEYKGDYLKLKSAQLGYTLPETLTRKAWMQQLRIFVSGENLLTLTSYPGIDPEKGSSISHPLMRQVTVGAQVTF